jgi:hypothetical protein
MDGAPQLERLILLPDFTGTEWQLPAGSAPGDRFLIGWNVSPDSADGESPAAVATLLSAVLCRLGTVTFASAMRKPGAWKSRWRQGRDFEWATATSVQDAAGRIFDADSFSWQRQGQVVVLSREGTAPVLTEKHLRLHDDPRSWADLAAAGASAVMLPGVDGQVAGLYCFLPGLRDELTRTLEEEVEKVGGRVVIADTHAFGGLLRGAG